MQTEPRVRSRAGHVPHPLTRSIRPKCLRTVDAQVVFEDGRGVMYKQCPTHGRFEALISSDADMYLNPLPDGEPGEAPLP